MDAEIAKLILQAGSATAALLALWLYHHSVQKHFEILGKQRADIERLVDACLRLADDRETLRGILLKTLEILATYDARTTAIIRENQPVAKRN